MSEFLRFFQITKTKEIGQFSVFAHVESNGKLNSKDSLNTESRNGKSRKHREDEKFTYGGNLENKI